MEDNRVVTEQYAWKPICLCVKLWCRLPGLHPWGLAGALVAGPGLFPDRLRRSSACACAAAASWRKTQTPIVNNHRNVSHTMLGLTKQVYGIISQKEDFFGCSKARVKISCFPLCFVLLSIWTLVRERERASRFEASEQSSYSAIRHNHPAHGRPRSLPSVTGCKGWAALRNMTGIKPLWASWYATNMPSSTQHKMTWNKK